MRFPLTLLIRWFLVASSTLPPVTAMEPIECPAAWGRREPRTPAAQVEESAADPRETAEPALTLGPAHDEPERWHELLAWNEAGSWPRRDGFSRRLPDQAVELRFEPEGAPQIRSIRIVGAAGTRARLAGGRVSVRGNHDQSWEQLDAQQPAWSRSHFGDELWIRANDAERIQVLELVELTPDRLDATPARSSQPAIAGCLVDPNCVLPDSDLALARSASGRMRFQSGAFSYTCSGGLIADTSSSEEPYFLTARHCIATQEEARSLEVTWDYATLGCYQSDSSALPTRSVGAELLIARKDLDVSLLRLSWIPSGRGFLGWTTAEPVDGRIRRISHPAGGPQVYSETIESVSISSCVDASTVDYRYQDPWHGSIAAGSSGAPSWITGARVVGQLSGTCGRGDCELSTDQLDGRFARSFRYLQPWLAPTEGVSAPADLRITFRGRRRIELGWTDASASETYYEVWRSRAGNDDVLVATLAADSSSATITPLGRRRMYRFRVLACNASGCSVPAEVWGRTR
jgi:hypothetical protein